MQPSFNLHLQITSRCFIGSLDDLHVAHFVRYAWHNTNWLRSACYCSRSLILLSTTMQYAKGRIIDMSDSSEDELDDYISSVFEDGDLAAVDKTATKYLIYTNSYVPQLGASEAFRETYQNWYVSFFPSPTHHRAH